MEYPAPTTEPSEPTHDPPPAPEPPSPAPEPLPGQPEPGGPPSHDPPIYPERAERSPGSHDQVQQTLDDALANSFPASDPVSIVTSQHEECWDPES